MSARFYFVLMIGIRTGAKVFAPRHFRRLIDESESLHPSHLVQIAIWLNFFAISPQSRRFRCYELIN